MKIIAEGQLPKGAQYLPTEEQGASQVKVQKLSFPAPSHSSTPIGLQRNYSGKSKHSLTFLYRS